MMALPNQWRLQGNYLMGITSDHWWSLLRQNRFHVDRPYWYRAGIMTLASGLSAALSVLESWRYGPAVDGIEQIEDPIFVLGHWRSGTTLLHELLALDTEQWAYPNTFQVMNPKTFLLTESVGARWLAGLVPNRRPMDNMSVEFSSPQEDEFALSLMTLQSYYLALSFPQAESRYERYLTFEDVSEPAIQLWKSAFLTFLKKLTFKYRRPLVLKSPPHTARIKLLLKLFPKARFIHIHRHPHDVFRSMQHYFATAGWLTYLQKPDLKAIDDGILRRYRVMYDAYFAQKSLIPRAQFHEIGFSALARDPIAQIQAIYRVLDLPYSAAFDESLRRYTQARQGYRKNPFPPLDPVIKQRIHQEWHRSFLEWNYVTE